MDFAQIIELIKKAIEVIKSIAEFVEKAGIVDKVKEYAPVVFDAIKDFVGGIFA